jgi:hypothetical protein
MAPLVAARDKVLRRERAVEQPQTMSRLQSRKAAINEQLHERRSTTRFQWDETSTSTGSATPLLDQPAKAAPGTNREASPSLQPETDAPGESYTERLLKAKKQVWHDSPDGKR